MRKYIYKKNNCDNMEKKLYSKVKKKLFTWLYLMNIF